MSLKKPSDLFNQKETSGVFESLESSSHITESYDKFRNNFDRVNELSEKIKVLSQELSKKLTKSDLEDAMLSQFMFLDENFKSLQSQVKCLNKKNLKEFKDTVVSLAQIVDNIVETELPKCKKQLTKNEFYIDEQINQLHVIVDNNVSEISEKINLNISNLSESTNEKFEEYENLIENLSGLFKEFSLLLNEEILDIKASIAINEQHFKNVGKYIQEHHQELVELKEEVFSEIEKLSAGNLQENLERLEKKIDYIKEIYSQIEPEVVVQEVIKEGLLNEPSDTKNEDPLTPLNQNYITLEQLQEHYRLFINRIQQQLSTIGGGGETRLKFLDDIVGIATNPGFYNGKFLKYDHSLGKFIFDQVDYSETAGIATYAQNLIGTPNINVGFTTITGVGNTALVVNGNARITGILTIGTGSITLDGSNNQVNVGTGVTIHHTNGVQVGSNTLHSTVLTVNNINASGVVTATTFSGGNIIASSATISGNVSVAGTLTYEDVTNVDSLGIVTARTGVRIDGGGLVVTAGVSTFPNVIVGGSTTSLVVNGDARITGILTIGTSSLTLDGNNNQIQVGTGVTITESGSANYSGIITATNFVGVGSELSFTQVGAGETSITFGSKFSEFVSVRDFGAVGDGIADDTDAIERAFSAVSGISTFSGSNKKIHFPAGNYPLTRTLVIGSNTTVLGDGPGITTITMPNNVSRNYSVVNIGIATTQSTNIHFEGITVDFNFNRWNKTGSAGPFAAYNGLQQNCISISNSKHVTIRDCRFIDGYRHCLDIIPASVSGGGKNISGLSTLQKYLQMPVYPSTLGGQYIKIDNCYFRGGGDDNLTTHYCSDVYITGCHSEYPRGGFANIGVVGNNNGFEIDDGSRNITITNCLAVGCKGGIEIKAHNYAPAPYNIVVDTVRIINCVSSFEAHHTDWIGPSNDAGSAYQVLGLNGMDPVTLASGTSYETTTYNGYSPMARNLSISNLQIIAPCSQTFQVKTSDTTWTTGISTSTRVFELGAYSNVIVNNLQISDGSNDSQLIADGYKAATPLSLGYLIHLHDSIRDFSFYNTSIFGCENIADQAFRINNVQDQFVINGLISRKGPLTTIHAENPPNFTGISDYSGLIDNVVINTGNEGEEINLIGYIGSAISLNNLKVQIGKVIHNGKLPQDVSSNSSRVITGSGSPEGVYYGGKGSLFLRNDATDSSTALYVKTTTKDLNTGWVAK